MECSSRSVFRFATFQMQGTACRMRGVPMRHRKNHGTAVQQDCSKFQNVAQYAVIHGRTGA